MYSKLPAEDEYLIYSKHVYRIFIGINFKKKVHMVGSYFPEVDKFLTVDTAQQRVIQNI